MKSEYLDTLLLYYEEEVAGEAYFYALQDLFPNEEQQEKLRLLAQVEHHSANSVLPLVQKYGLHARPIEELHSTGRSHISAHQDWSWTQLITYMTQRYPLYLDDFAHLEDLAPNEDQPPLKFLTKHEVAAIEFAVKELAGATDSAYPLRAYLDESPPLPLS